MAPLIRKIAILVLAISTSAFGQDCPPPRCFDGVIKVIVPFAPGGSTDIVARRWAEQLSLSLSQQVVVENRGGAGGVLGADYVARSPADSRTILVSNQGPIAISPSVLRKMPFDPSKDLIPSVQIAQAPQAIVVRSDSNITDLRALARKSGGATYGTSGAGSIGHLLGLQLAGSPGASLTHVPYRGSAAALIDLAGGQVDAVIVELGNVDLRSGRYRALAVTGQQRTSAAPSVPTLAELGFEGLNSGWVGAFFPAGTPSSVVSRLNTETRKILQDPAFRVALETAGLQPGSLGTTAFAALIQQETARFQRAAAQQNFKLD